MKTRKQYFAIWRAIAARRGLPYANVWMAENPYQVWRTK